MCMACSALFRYILKEGEFAFHPLSILTKTAQIWIFKPEFSHFLFPPYRTGFQSFKCSALPPGGLEIKFQLSQATDFNSLAFW